MDGCIDRLDIGIIWYNNDNTHDNNNNDNIVIIIIAAIEYDKQFRRVWFSFTFRLLHESS